MPDLKPGQRRLRDALRALQVLEEQPDGTMALATLAGAVAADPRELLKDLVQIDAAELDGVGCLLELLFLRGTEVVEDPLDADTVAVKGSALRQGLGLSEAEPAVLLRLLMAAESSLRAEPVIAADLDRAVATLRSHLVGVVDAPQHAVGQLGLCRQALAEGRCVEGSYDHTWTDERSPVRIAPAAILWRWGKHFLEGVDLLTDDRRDWRIGGLVDVSLGTSCEAPSPLGLPRRTPVTLRVPRQGAGVLDAYRPEVVAETATSRDLRLRLEDPLPPRLAHLLLQLPPGSAVVGCGDPSVDLTVLAAAGSTLASRLLEHHGL